MKPKRDTPGYRKFVEAVREVADVVDVRLGRAGFVEYEYDGDSPDLLRVTHHDGETIIRMPRFQALKLEDAGMGTIVGGADA